MRILILGATGRVGRKIVDKALIEGHEVIALIRNPEKLAGVSSERLSILQGDTCREGDIQHAIRHVQMVISCLSTDGSTVLTESMPLIIKAMEAQSVRRIVTIGTAGILESREHAGLLRYETPDARRSSTRAAEEHRKAWELLAASGLSWTVVCPTYLPDGEPQGHYRVERDFLPEGGMSISVGDTAAFTYRVACEGEYVGCRVGIAY
jgi:putative NADH-flavin reductase